MNSFLRLILKVLVTMIILAICIRFSTYKIYGTEEINQANLNWFIAQADTTDHLFVGSSLCYSGIDNFYFNKKTKLKSYNIGYATAGPILVNEILNKIDLSRIRSIIWIISPNDLIDITDNIDSYPYFLFNKFDEIKYYNRGLLNAKSLVGINQKRLFYFLFRNEKMYAKRRGRNGEFISFQNDPSADSSSTVNTLRGKTSNGRKGRLLLEIIKANPKISVAIYPFDRFASAYKPAIISEFNNIVKILRRNKVKVFDLNMIDDALIKPSDWRNYDHLNSQGARKITGMIADSLLANSKR